MTAENDVYQERDLRARAADIHDYHNVLPGYHPDQIWHDGCHVCGARGELVAIHQLDRTRFHLAWNRADEWQKHGLRNMAYCERKLFEVLNACRNQGLTLYGR